MGTKPSRSLETFPNPKPERDYVIRFDCPEFTCLCPKTGQPDFATIRIRYVPDRHLVELKSVKLYIWSYRNEGAFHEDVSNRILNDFVAAAGPRWIEVVGDFSVRCGRRECPAPVSSLAMRSEHPPAERPKRPRSRAA